MPGPLKLSLVLAAAPSVDSLPPPSVFRRFAAPNKVLVSNLERSGGDALDVPMSELEPDSSDWLLVPPDDVNSELLVFVERADRLEEIVEEDRTLGLADDKSVLVVREDEAVCPRKADDDDPAPGRTDAPSDFAFPDASRGLCKLPLPLFCLGRSMTNMGRERKQSRVSEGSAPTFC